MSRIGRNGYPTNIRSSISFASVASRASVRSRHPRSRNAYVPRESSAPRSSGVTRAVTRIVPSAAVSHLEQSLRRYNVSLLFQAGVYRSIALRSMEQVQAWADVGAYSGRKFEPQCVAFFLGSDVGTRFLQHYVVPADSARTKIDAYPVNRNAGYAGVDFKMLAFGSIKVYKTQAERAVFIVFKVENGVLRFCVMKLPQMLGVVPAF